MSATLMFGGLLGVVGFAMWGQLSPDPREFGKGRSDRQIRHAIIGAYLSLAAAFAGAWLR